MAGTGWENPLPAALGGGPGDAELALRALLDLLGQGWAPQESDTDPERLFYEAAAEGLAVARAFGEHAVMQAYPEIASDYLAVYEQQLGLVPGPGDYEQDRRVTASNAYGSVQAAVGPGLRADLQAIDSRADLIGVQWAQEDAANCGRRPWGDGGESYGVARAATGYPEYSTAVRVRVLIDVGYSGPLTAADEAQVRLVRAHLQRVLPATCGFSVVTAVGLGADYAPVDYTGS